MIQNFKKIASLLSRRQRLGALALLFVMLLTGLAQVASVTSILPFMAVVSNPGLIQSNPFLSNAYELLGFTSNQSFLIFLGVVVILSIVCVNAISIFGAWFQVRFIWAVNLHISSRLLEKFLKLPYLFFLSHNSSKFSNAVLQESNQFTQAFLKPSLELLAQAVTILSLLALVVFVDPVVALVAVTVFGGIYAAIYHLIRRKSKRLGEERVRSSQARFKVAQEAFGTIKETKILQREDHFVRSYRKPTLELSRIQVWQSVVSQTPRFVLEALAFGGMVSLVVYLLASGAALSEFLPLISLYALAGYRLMPALQSAFNAFSQLRFNEAVVEHIHREMMRTGSEMPISQVSSIAKNERSKSDAPLPFRREIELRKISFSYPDAPRPALNNLSLTIGLHQSVAVCGPTGSGKTTAIDILLGLMDVDSGGLFVDGTRITASNRRAWQRNLGYVPQSIYLSDSTIAKNIAFGLDDRDIDHEAVRRAARIANIAEFIERELPLGYGTVVGERGVRLSGGQRQRIGIARALYQDPEVLILDEATSALDGATEEAVMEAVRNVAQAKTVILIAHRLSTVRDCDQIFLLGEGEVVAQGTYQDLSSNSSEFRRMAGGVAPLKS